MWNLEEGPDFLRAAVRVGDEVVRGDVEVHVNSSGWSGHGHHRRDLDEDGQREEGPLRQAGVGHDDSGDDGYRRAHAQAQHRLVEGDHALAQEEAGPVQKAIELLDGQDLKGRKLRISQARKQRDRF